MAASRPALDPTKGALADALGAVRDELTALSEDLHAHPETAFAETVSARRTAGVLAAHGFSVEEGTGGLPTAFRAEAGAGPLVVVVCAEYDALPGIGHACGHNIIAAAAVGAGIALAGVADDLGITVRVLGCPAEEGGGGKVTLLERGAFDGAGLAMMVHPWPQDRLAAQCLAVSHVDVHYAGRAAHASAAPWEGVNAADALVLAQVAIGLLRQQLAPGDQVHGIVRQGGSAANVIPAAASGRFMCRAPDLAALGILEERVWRCFEAGALATGATVDIEELAPRYSHMEVDDDLIGCYRRNAETLGRRFDADDAGVPLPTLSTDMANVSLQVPTVHPLVGIDASGAVNHQPAFADACVGPSAEAALLDGATAMAWTAVDAARGDLRRRLVARQATTRVPPKG